MLLKDYLTHPSERSAGISGTPCSAYSIDHVNLQFLRHEDGLKAHERLSYDVISEQSHHDTVLRRIFLFAIFPTRLSTSINNKGYIRAAI